MSCISFLVTIPYLYSIAEKLILIMTHSLVQAYLKQILLQNTRIQLYNQIIYSSHF